MLYPAELQAHFDNRRKGGALFLERVMGIEPTQPAWKAGVLPLNYTRMIKALFMIPQDGTLVKLNLQDFSAFTSISIPSACSP